MAITIGSQLGSYEITALLGKGGFGEVYRAKDKKLKREVAIKILPDGRDEAAQIERQLSDPEVEIRYSGFMLMYFSIIKYAGYHLWG